MAHQKRVLSFGTNETYINFDVCAIARRCFLITGLTQKLSQSLFSVLSVPLWFVISDVNPIGISLQPPSYLEDEKAPPLTEPTQHLPNLEPPNGADSPSH